MVTCLMQTGRWSGGRAGVKLASWLPVSAARQGPQKLHSPSLLLPLLSLSGDSWLGMVGGRENYADVGTEELEKEV